MTGRERLGEDQLHAVAQPADGYRPVAKRIRDVETEKAVERDRASHVADLEHDHGEGDTHSATVPPGYDSARVPPPGFEPGLNRF